MPRNTGTINGTPDKIRFTGRLIDASGDVSSFSMDVPAAATNAQLEAVASTYGAITNASFYEAIVSNVYNTGVAQKSNALALPQISVEDVINVSLKNSLGLAQIVELRAPDLALFVDESDVVDLTNADLLALFSAIETALGSLYGGTWAVVSVRYTERTEKNSAQKV